MTSLIFDVCRLIKAATTASPPSSQWHGPFQRPVREHPSGRSISCGASPGQTSSLFFFFFFFLSLPPSLFPAFCHRNSLRRRFFPLTHLPQQVAPVVQSRCDLRCFGALSFQDRRDRPPPPISTPTPPPPGMRGLPQRNRRNLHV